MIPKSIERAHVESAIHLLLTEGYDSVRESTRYDLVAAGGRLPPKMVVSVAGRFAHGSDLAESEFSGGHETNSFLRSLGFVIAPKAGVRPQVWVFQGNPDTFDMDEYLRTCKDPLWSIRQAHHADGMAVGDEVFVWRAAGSKSKAVAGAIAHGFLAEKPREQADDSRAMPLWRKPSENRPGLRVRLSIDRVASSKQVVKRDWLKADPVLHAMRIMKLASQTNYLLNDAQAARLRALWENTGRDWTREECIAGLWAYARTFGGEVSRTRDSLIADVAARVGRAVSGVYAKAMNFRSLDPRHEGAGRTSTGDAAKLVWAEFFDSNSGEMRDAELNAAYETLWGESDAGYVMPEPEPSAESESSPGKAKDAKRMGRSGGQGYMLDKHRRKAVEMRAMDLAAAHYTANGYEVTQTHTTHPFDLRCRKAGEEVRVEVKGTTGTGATVELTHGEVNNTRGTAWRTDLFLVTGIVVEGAGVGAVALGGVPLFLTGWSPSDESLLATRFRHSVDLSAMEPAQSDEESA